ncbi:MAG: ATP-binding protein [Candidatus Kapabacteria bacterium]|nr:ATP-binding protein [Candidatus Kapabacteria bacterium]
MYYFMYITRDIEQKILQTIAPNKVIVITGARRTGKTILLSQLIKKIKEPIILLNGEDILTHELLERRSIINFKNLMGTKKLLIIDEAQKIIDIGLKLKLMVDNIEGLKIIVTGSSAFDITNKVGEPLTGRKYSFNLFPFSENELSQIEDDISKRENLRERLVFGNYPELSFLSDRDKKQEYLREIVSSYLLKDILTFENLRSSSKIFDLLKLIAFQVGNEVSYNELSKQLGISKTTVERYLDLLTKVFILHKIGGYSRNLRKEVVKSSKWYFWDNGIRNAIIANFTNLNSRDDVGKLWENYIISERLKFQSNKSLHSNNYFWRTYDKQEIDWIEEREGKLFAYEFKWKELKSKAPLAWVKTYPNSDFKVINSENFYSWIS